MMKTRRITRDARTGMFTLARRARTAPTQTITARVPVRQPTKKITRDARTGQFVPPERARTAPTRTVTASVPR